MPLTAHRFATREALLDALYSTFVDTLEQALQRRQRASLMLSGGSTPGPLYQRLSEAGLDWSKVEVALVDERWVDPGHAASNERLLRHSLLQNAASGARFTGMKNAAASPFEGLSDCNHDYAKLPLPHSICLLGMGPDGHTASLFPRAEGLQQALQSVEHCAAIRAQRSEVTGELVERMTLTPWSILQSERLILLITGNEKWDLLQRAGESDDAMLTPISHFIHHAPALEVYWAP